MTKLLKKQDNYRWDISGIEFAINERIGHPEDFIGRFEEMEYLYGWAHRIRDLRSRSLAFFRTSEDR